MNADWQTQFAIMLFSCAVLLMYSASSIYHWTIPGRTKQILRYVDHINIYTLIAASYTPILLCSIKGVLGWSMFLFLWSAALVGAIYKLFFLGKYPKLSLVLYLSMGWSALFIARSVWINLPKIALFCILLEGVFYTVGTYFYANDRKQPYFHATWHLFVLLGTIMHCLAIWYIL